MGMMGKLKETQKKVEETKERLHSVLIDESSNDNKLKVTITANRTVKSITIEDELLQDKEMLEDYLILTINKAIERATSVHETEVASRHHRDRCRLPEHSCLPVQRRSRPGDRAEYRNDRLRRPAAVPVALIQHPGTQSHNS